MALDTTASTILWSQPDWLDPDRWLPTLAAYVALADPDGDTCLVFDASDGTVPPGVAVELLATASQSMRTTGRLADILILDAPEEPPVHALPVDGADAVAMALGATLPPLPEQPDLLLDHARWAKGVFDAARDRLDRHRFETAPDPFADESPLVSVRIPTYGDVDALMTRTLPSVLNGQWQNIEVVVCSDGPQPHACEAVATVTDPRVRYVEVPERIPYPTHFHAFWQVAGAHAANHALEHCRGAFICPLDHDDAFSFDHVVVLLQAAHRRRADFVYGQAFCEDRSGPWFMIGREPLQHGHIVHSSVMYSSRLQHLRHDEDCWLIDEPGDWNLWRRMTATGAQPAFVPHPVLAHFRERTAIEDDPATAGHDLRGPVAVPVEDQVESLHATGARRLLALPRRSPTLVLP